MRSTLSIEPILELKRRKLLRTLWTTTSINRTNRGIEIRLIPFKTFLPLLSIEPIVELKYQFKLIITKMELSINRTNRGIEMKECYNALWANFAYQSNQSWN